LSYIQRRKVSELIEDHEIFDAVNLLPTQQARKVIKAYLAKTENLAEATVQTSYGISFRSSPDRALSPLRTPVGLCGDRQIAESVFKIMLLTADAGDEFGLWGVSPYFTKESAQLLKRGLMSSDENLRAWCLWQLRKIGYEFDKTELAKLLKDENWKVRANAVLTSKAITTLAEKDHSHFVRLVESFSAESQH
jgi:hypothetical protein